jgi:hypothetical protein
VAPEPTPDPLPLPEPLPESAAPPEATTRIVTEATRTDERPQTAAPASSPRPQARPVRLAPAPVPPATAAAQTPAPPPDALTAALAEAMAAPDATGTGGAGTAAAGPPLTAGEIDGLRRAISACWTVGAASTETLRSVVTLGISMRRDGTPETVRLISAKSPSEAAGSVAYDIARRTVLRCARNATLPPEKYDSWREIEMVFDYNGMRLR